MEDFLSSGGYLATSAATFVEGEVLLLTSILAAKVANANYWGILAAAYLGAYTRDWIIFLLARKRGQRFIEKREQWAAKLARTQGWLLAYPNLVLIGYRMVYGFSTVIILLSGVSQMPAWRYGLLTALGCLLWVGIYGGLGWFFAEAMLHNLAFISQHVSYVLLGVGSVAALVYGYKKYAVRGSNV